MYKLKQTLLAAFTLVLLANATSFAQDNDEKKNIRIRIQINDDDRKVNIDTTFTDEASLQRWMKENNFDEPAAPPAPPKPPIPPAPGTPGAPEPPMPPAEPKAYGKNFHMRIFTDKEKAELKEEMKKLEEELEETMNGFEGFNFDMNFSGDGENDLDVIIKKFGGQRDSFYYSFSFPDCEKLKEEMKELTDNMKSFSFSFESDDDEAGVKGKKRSSKVIIIESDKKKDAKKEKKKDAEIKKEKEPKDENKDKKSKGQTSFELAPDNFQLSPNPGKGLYNLSFDLASTEPVTVKILDFAGRQVFKDVAENFTGHYQNQIDITGRSRGTYLLQIRQGENWMHKKLLLN